MSNENISDEAVEAAVENAAEVQAAAGDDTAAAESAVEAAVEAVESVEQAADDYDADAVAEPAFDRGPVVIDRPIQTVGRRKEAVVRVRLVPGSGQFHLNGRTIEEYFPNKVHQQLIKAPLVTVERTESFDIYAKLVGGGPSGQAGALRLAIARALIEVTPEDRPALKKAGFLTRDPRAVERKKYGLKKARKASQYSKR
ncbi:30S ribosomal protein S9 [Gordonia polyisoprenivorans VH2]|uniref:Small ribosomal subunit protein uS9 n=2 Tax=Gordonia polyisoprenivorans TaxID=84595 RepID=H6MTE6_GORPV|nr:30S ribosomal protein S9 [Gordonia polyisoprenivorans]AFA72630.1 30S ribosomal protein S9 [Gordonia polyisoprenivorans VH2]MBE7192541.1 30S ribosomal protein S9 [Gordonia polyisoprenivorans]NKY01278.1 30S ribosomal protein S9 [Gordonia polyisoprenivorans]OZC29750.1 30S ribosomal protein S9 [Gordonia polyisoprenivorans]QUD81299.1 30S ribosomal protein S9 [Gordonia polyisoprenivorans]